MAKVLSIEVGFSTTKIVEMDHQKKKPKVYRCVDTKTPEGAIRDGYLNPDKMEALKDQIRDALRDNKIRTKRVIFTVFSTKIISREIMISAVKEHQIGAFIESNLSEYFPIDLSDYKIAHFVIRTYRDGENEGKHKVLVMAAEKSLIQGYEKLAEAIGLYIADVDYIGNSVIQATKLNAGAEAIMTVKVEDENALVTILRQGTMMMQRTVNYQVGHMDDDILPEKEECYKILTGTVTRLIDYYASNNDDNRIAQIYIIGDGSRDWSITDLMTEQTGIPSRFLENVRATTITRRADNNMINVYAAAIGAGIDISKPCGNMIVDIGGGTTDVAVISLSGTVVSASIKVAGDDFDEAIVRYMRKKHNLLIGERTAEDIKIKIGTCYPLPENETMDVRGRNLVTGLPRTITVSSEETEEALREATLQIVEAVHSVLEKTPPELAADVADRGIVLTGGGALLRGLEELIEEKTGINTMTAEHPMTCVAIGTGKYVEFLAGKRDEE